MIASACGCDAVVASNRVDVDVNEDEDFLGIVDRKLGWLIMVDVVRSTSCTGAATHAIATVVQSNSAKQRET